MYSQLHLNFYELSPVMRAEIKEYIINNYKCVLRHNGKTEADVKDIGKIINWDQIFDLNNAGIDIDAPAYML